MGTVPLEIVQAGHPVLRQPSRELTVEEIRSAPIQELIARMRDCMRAAPGVGLAAPQIGEPLQLFVVEDPPELQQHLSAAQRAAREREPVAFHVIANPVLEMPDADTVEFFEGCLSVPGYMAVVPRARTVRITGLDDRGEPVSLEAHGWHARILQHEVDHLHGRLYIDRMRARTFSTVTNHAEHWQQLDPGEVVRALADR